MLLKKTSLLALPLTLVSAAALHSAAATVGPSTPWSIRINSGGPAYTDSSGNRWVADDYFTGGTSAATTNAISNAADPTIYQSERYGLTAYHIPVPHAGIYSVSLHFAENSATAPGQRVFTISAEGQDVVPSLDLASAIGASTAYDVTVPVRTDDAVIDLNFSATANDPLISGIEVVDGAAATSPAPTASAPAPTRFPTRLTSVRRTAVVAGSRVLCTGRLTRTTTGAAVPGALVAVSLRPDVGPGKVIQVRTNSTGTWGLLCTPTYSSLISARFAGDALNVASSVPAYRMSVFPRVTISSPVSGRTSTASHRLVVRGAISPNKAGHRVVLYRVVRGGRLVALARTTVTRTGAWRFSVALRRGDYWLKTVIGGTTGNVAGSSGAFLVRRR